LLISRDGQGELGRGITCLCLLLLVCLPLAGCSHELSYFQIREWGDDLAPETLIEALKNKDWRIRQEAALNLGRIGDIKAVESLVTVLKDEDWRVQLEAAKALGKIGEPKAIGPLEELLQSSSNLRVRQAAKKALAKVKRR